LRYTRDAPTGHATLAGFSRHSAVSLYGASVDGHHDRLLEERRSPPATWTPRNKRWRRALANVVATVLVLFLVGTGRYGTGPDGTGRDDVSPAVTHGVRL
jgi:hypothetical protein